MTFFCDVEFPARVRRPPQESRGAEGGLLLRRTGPDVQQPVPQPGPQQQLLGGPGLPGAGHRTAGCPSGPKRYTF